MLSKYKMTSAEKQELEEYRNMGLSPRQIKSIQMESARLREYIEWLETM